MPTFGGETGGDEQARQKEAKKLIDIIGDPYKHKNLEVEEIDFIRDMQDKFKHFGTMAFVSPKQLFWLRDLKDKVI